MSLANKHLVLITGPTCSGKSQLARAIALEFNGQIINADSMQVYSDLQIITSRPRTEDLLSVKHRMYGYLDGSKRGNVASWHKLAIKEISQSNSEETLPIVVGGTGLYLNSLINGISEIPEPTKEIKKYVDEEKHKFGLRSIYEKLEKIDPLGSKKIKPNDVQRIIRSYEVFLTSGEPLTFWQRKKMAKPLECSKIYKLLVLPNRSILYQMCNSRFDEMLSSGGIEEVLRLKERSLDPSLPVMNAIGVRELSDFLDGDICLEDAVSKSKQLTRNYAKRQFTWFKNQFNSSTIVFEQFSESLCTKIFPKIRQFLLT